MKTFLFSILTLLFIIFSTQTVTAQSYLDEEIPRFRHQAKLGYPVEIGLSIEFPKTGMHISYNPTYKMTDFISIEGQASFTYADFERNSSTFARDGGVSQSLNFLGGGRIYVLGESSPVRFYVNVMAGFLQYVTSEYNIDGDLENSVGYGLGFSTGFFAQYNNTWSLGVSLETRNFLILRAGYTF